MSKQTRILEQLEEEMMIAMLKDIAGSQDPIEQFKGIERYHKFILARKDRLQSEAVMPNKSGVLN